MNKYLFDVTTYRFWSGKRISVLTVAIEVEADNSAAAFGRAVEQAVREHPLLPQGDTPGPIGDCQFVEIRLARCGDAGR